MDVKCSTWPYKGDYYLHTCQRVAMEILEISNFNILTMMYIVWTSYM